MFRPKGTGGVGRAQKKNAPTVVQAICLSRPMQQVLPEAVGKFVYKKLNCIQLQ